MHGVNSVLIFACILIFDFFFYLLVKKKKSIFRNLPVTNPFLTMLVKICHTVMFSRQLGLYIDSKKDNGMQKPLASNRNTFSN